MQEPRYLTRKCGWRKLILPVLDYCSGGALRRKPVLSRMNEGLNQNFQFQGNRLQQKYKEVSYSTAERQLFRWLRDCESGLPKNHRLELKKEAARESGPLCLIDDEV